MNGFPTGGLHLLLACLPPLTAGVLILRRIPPGWAGLGALAAGLAVLPAFKPSPAVLVESVTGMAPLALEVLLIMYGGIVLFAVLRPAGLHQALGQGVASLVPDCPLRVLLVALGVTPFLESVTGFGVGLIMAAPIRRRSGALVARNLTPPAASHRVREVWLMRRRMAVVVTVLVLVGVGLAAWRTAASPEPPAVRVTSGGESIAVQQGSYCWRDLGRGICVDRVGPRELVEGLEPARVEPGAQVEFRFGRKPSEVAVHLWPEGEPQEVPLVGARSFAAPQEPGTYVYSVFARWDGRGDATYAFTIRVEEP